MEREEAKRRLDSMFEVETIMSAQADAGDPWDDDMIIELLEHIRALRDADIGV